ncbi:MAG: tRNA pseudouridine13 synthase [Parcubacteria group bacterium]|nr:tRNA pseudouridine13 synthase [Parcubacteria group bacterium]
MDSDRMRLKALEREKLEKEKAIHPEFFPEQAWVDDKELLETLGIHIPNKENLPSAYLKLLPSDFIVEEETQTGYQTDTLPERTALTGEDGGTVYATLVKCGLSTIEAVDELAKLLNTTKDKIQYAGIKDKDAVTSQEISFRGSSLEAIKNMRSPHFFLKDVRPGKGIVMRGGLNANRFTILLRIGEDMEDKAKMKNALEALERVKNEGFYNYFYLQRFGSPRLNNYKWGLSILKGDYEKAVRGLISDPGLREIPFFLKQREEIIALAPDWAKVLARLNEFPLVFPSEIRVVGHLVQKPTDFLGALMKIEEQVVLWVSAVASLMYNRKVSAYLMAGMEPPRTLPLFLSPDKNDWLPYMEDMENVGIFPPNFNTLRSFQRISIMHKEIETKDKPKIHAAEVIAEGIVVNFSLGKGEYATTFLSHFVNLLNGWPPKEMNGEIIDLKKHLGQEPLEKTLKYFETVNLSKKNE